MSETEQERRLRIEEEYRRKVVEEENEKQRQAELEEQERIKRLEKARKEKEARDHYNNTAMGEREKQQRLEEAKFRKQQQEERNRAELERQKQATAEKAKLFEEEKRRSQSDLLSELETDEGGESIYDKEERIRQDQLRRMAEGLPVNLSYDDKLKGFDAEIADKLREKTDPQMESKVAEWVGKLTGEVIYNIGECLKSGRVLCELMNKIKPGIIPRYNTRPIALMERENIQLYLKACEQIGMSKSDLFHVADLHDLRDISLIINNLIALSAHSHSISEFKGPYLELATPKSVRIRTDSPKPSFSRSATTSQIKRPALPANFTSSDPSVQFKLQQEQQIKEEFENKEKEIQRLRKESEGYKKRLEGIQVWENEENKLIAGFSVEHMLGIIGFKLKIKDTTDIANKLNKAGITDYKRLALVVKNKELWDRFDLNSAVKSLLEDIYERGVQVENKQIPKGKFASAKENLKRKWTTVNGMAVKSFHYTMWSIGVLTTVASTAYIVYNYGAAGIPSQDVQAALNYLKL